MIGSGRASVAEICEISRANLADGMQNEAREVLASLGAGGDHPSNQERDLLRWLKTYVSLESFNVEMALNVPWTL